nr:hypothetical protein [Streptomyces sp. 846.5]
MLECDPGLHPWAPLRYAASTTTMARLYPLMTALRIGNDDEWAREYASRPSTTAVQSPKDVFRELDSLVSTVGELTWA